MRLLQPPLRVKNHPRTLKPLLGAKIPVASGNDLSAQLQAEGRVKTSGQAPVPVQGASVAEPQAGAGTQSLGMHSFPGKHSLVFFKETADALGLPKDNLSVALIAFTRFFSLSPSTALLSTLRRELLSLSKTFSSESAVQRAGQEAETMAAVVAADKGVVLSPEALERYASYLLPPDPVDSEESPPDRNENFSSEEMRKQAEEQAKKDDFLELMNTLPGKNGQYWKVFPLVIKVKGVELRVFLRILQDQALSSDGSEYLIADISSPKRQWRCLLKKEGFNRSADIRVYPEYHPRALNLLKKKAKQFLDGFGNVMVQNGDKIPSWVEDLFAQPLPSINEEV